MGGTAGNGSWSIIRLVTKSGVSKNGKLSLLWPRFPFYALGERSSYQDSILFAWPWQSSLGLFSPSSAALLDLHQTLSCRPHQFTPRVPSKDTGDRLLSSGCNMVALVIANLWSQDPTGQKGVWTPSPTLSNRTPRKAPFRWRVMRAQAECFPFFWGHDHNGARQMYPGSMWKTSPPVAWLRWKIPHGFLIMFSINYIL